MQGAGRWCAAILGGGTVWILCMLWQAIITCDHAQGTLIVPMHRSREDDAVMDIEQATRLCRRFGYTPRLAQSGSEVAKPRRIFWGGLIADEPRVIIEIMAKETNGLLHAVSFCDSNITQTGAPRKQKYLRGTADHTFLENKIKAIVTVDEYIEYPVNKTIVNSLHWSYLLREGRMRSVVTRRWAALGMKANDIGVIADMDEVFSRDFIQCMRVCSIPQFEAGFGCDRPKIVARTKSFEGFPDCVGPRIIFHPDAISGRCIRGVGGFSEKYWDGWDFRARSGGYQHPMFTAYHIHNFWDNVTTFRRKYHTFGEANPRALEVNISQMHPDLKDLTTCMAKGRKTLQQEHARGTPGRPDERDQPLYFNEGFAEKQYVLLKKCMGNE